MNGCLGFEVVEHDVSSQFPEVLVVECGGVGADLHVDFEHVVEAHEEESLREFPAWWFCFVIDSPFLRHDFVAHDAGVGDEFCHSEGGHHR